jgi:hypothetical protein
MRRFLLFAVATAIVLAGAAPSFAGRSSIRLAQDASRSDGTLNFADTVGFDITTPYWDAAGGRGPWVRVTCSKDGTVVSQESHGYFEGYYLDQVFSLGPTNLWDGGAATCQADLGHWSKSYGRFQVEASLRFDVAA